MPPSPGMDKPGTPLQIESSPLLKFWVMKA